MRSSIASITLSTAVWLFVAKSACAAPPQAAAVRELLTVGWQAGPAALPAARKSFDKAKGLGPRDPRVPYAMALVHLKARQTHEAGQMLDAALTLSPADLDVRRTQIWIDLYERQYQGAAAGMRGLAEAIPAQPKDDAALSSARQAATFLGRMHGFLSGPAEGQIPPLRVKAVDTIARKRLSGELLSAYEAGDAAVKAQFKKLAAEKPSKPKPPADKLDATEPEEDEATKVQRSLTTYEKYPLEAERRRLLKLFE